MDPSHQRILDNLEGHLVRLGDRLVNRIDDAFLALRDERRALERRALERRVAELEMQVHLIQEGRWEEQVLLEQQAITRERVARVLQANGMPLGAVGVQPDPAQPAPPGHTSSSS